MNLLTLKSGGIPLGEGWLIMTITSREKIEQHLIQQKARAVQPGELLDGSTLSDRCQYRTDSGMMCAAGCLIPDAKYDPSMEGLTVNGVQRGFPDIFPNDISERELSEWQNYHDNYTMLRKTSFSYKQWINGDEDHHPSKFKQAIVDYIELIQGFDS